MRVSGWRAVAALGLGVGLEMLTGCGGFFVYPGSTTTGSGSSGSSTGDYAFVSNSTAGTNYIAAYSVSSGGLTTATGSPTALSYEPQAMVVSTNNSYLFVASGLNIYGYSIGSGGALTQIGSGALANDTAESMAVSPDGQWLITLDNESALAAPTLNVYEILSGGTLSNSAAVSSVSVNAVNSNPITLISADAMQVSPNGNYIAVALGTGGVEVFPFNTSSGAITSSAVGISGTASTGFFAVAIDANNDLYITGTNSSGNEVIQSYGVSSTGTAVTVSTNPTSSFSVGNRPVWITVNAIGTSTTNADVYVANSKDSTISAFSASSGILTQLNGGTAYSAPTYVSAMGRETTGSYLVALGYNTSSGVQTFTVGSAGTLTADATAGSSATSSFPATVPTVIAMTH